MKKESRERIIKAYENASELLGFPNLDSGLKYMFRELERRVQALRHVRNGASLERCLVQEPELTPEQLDATVKSIELIPYQVRKVLPEAAKEAQKHLPHEPGGRPRAIPPEEHAKVCEEIGYLFSQGVTLKDAQQRVARRKNASLRTVQRIWQRRKTLAARIDAEANEPANV